MNQPAIDLRYYRQQYAEVITDPEQLGYFLNVRFDSPDEFARTLPFAERDTTVGVEPVAAIQAISAFTIRPTARPWCASFSRMRRT